MRDAAAVEDAGIPAIAIIHDVFARAAQLQAEVLGRPDLTRIVVPQGQPESSDDDVDRLARGILDEITAVLAASAASAAR